MFWIAFVIGLAALGAALVFMADMIENEEEYEEVYLIV